MGGLIKEGKAFFSIWIFLGSSVVLTLSALHPFDSRFGSFAISNPFDLQSRRFFPPITYTQQTVSRLPHLYSRTSVRTVTTRRHH